MGGRHGARLSNGGCGFHPRVSGPQGRHSCRHKQEGRQGRSVSALIARWRERTDMPQSITILIVDDNVNLAQGFAQVLKSVGYAALTAYTAEDGLRLAQIECPDAIILDIRMPFINGVGFLYRLRALEAHRHTPVMVLTGASVNEEMRAELCDLRALLRFKPLGMSELLAETRTLLAHDWAGPSDTTNLKSSVA
ncbi:MAG: hypothetical protein DMF92_00710 [Acidobacteria bacterium]|nr:MAG: hypothetical protein DMF92_00710 [Acidobacteriota bacterium]